MRFTLVLILVSIFFIAPAFSQPDLSLRRTIEIAYEQSPTILKAQADMEAARGQAGQIVAAYLPQLAVNGSIGKAYSEPTSMQITIGSTTAVYTMGIDEQANTNSYSASLSQAIFAGGKIWNSLSLAHKALDIAEQEYRKVYQQLKFDVIKAFYEVQKAEKMVELGEDSLAMAMQHLEYVESMQKVGMVTKAEVLRSKVQEAQANIAYIKANQGLELAKNAFNEILGKDLDAKVNLAHEELNIEAIQVYAYEDLLQIAYTDRPDWIQFELNKKVTEDQVKIAAGGLFPAVSVVGNYDVGSTQYSSLQINSKNWTAVVSGTWNLFDGTATFNKIREARAKLDSQKAQEKSVKRSVAVDVKNTCFLLKSAKENLLSNKTAKELAIESYEIAELRYRSGLDSNLEEIDAQVALTQAKVEYLQAEHELNLALAGVNKAIGRDIY